MLLQNEEGEEESGNTDRRIDVEDPAPAGVIDEPATQDRADRRRNRRRYDQHRRSGGALVRWEGAEEHGRADRRHHAAADTLQYPEEDQRIDAPGASAEGRAEREHGQREEEDLLRAEAIPHPARCGDPDRQTQ